MLAIPVGRNEGQVTQASSNEVQHAKQQREREKGTVGIAIQVKFNFKGVDSKDRRAIAPQRRALPGRRVPSFFHSPNNQVHQTEYGAWSR
jgi:hypothetical protein